jgi:hypothetical protein
MVNFGFGAAGVFLSMADQVRYSDGQGKLDGLTSTM